MASTITTDGLSPSTAAGIPAIRTFQIDPSGLGGIAESVNLYRGDVTLPLDLVSFQSPGGLETRVSIVYSSHVGLAVDTWNLDAPTGPLGLGWSLGYSFIALEDVRAGVVSGNVYLMADGVSNRLFETAVFGDYREYEPEQYQYWRIRYYHADERWEIVKEDGKAYIYGGRQADLATSPVQYGIKWGGPQGNWSDASIVSTGQTRVPIGWNLAEIRSTWGHRILLEYQNDLVPLGRESGLSFTRSSRLLRVSDPTGRTFLYKYEPKRYDKEIREYQIPHLDPARPTLAAYQDRFDTHYLDWIDVIQSGRTPDEGLLLRVKFGYSFENISLAHQRDPDYFKRYLRSVTMHTRDGLSLPNFHFDYVTGDDDRKATLNRGGLSRIVYPQGGIVTYDFAETPLAGTSREAQISGRGVPRVWFGSDYAVVTRTDGDRRGLDVRVRMWNGQWTESTTTWRFPVDIDQSTLQVSAEADFFAVSFLTPGSNRRLYLGLFHKEPGRLGHWLTEDFTALQVGASGNQGLAVTGTGFVIALTSGGSIVAKVWDRLTNAWIERSRQFNLDANGQFALAAFDDYFTLATYRASGLCDLDAFRLNDTSQSFERFRLQVDRLSRIKWDNERSPSRFWALGSNFMVMTYITGGDDRRVTYAVQIQQWNETLSARLVVDESYTLDAYTMLPFAQSVASGSVVGNIGHLFRFDGVEWQRGELPFTESDPPPRFMYGSDLAVASGAKDGAMMQFDPYKNAWAPPITITTTSEGIAPTISGDYVTLGRDLYYRSPSGKIDRIASLDANMNPKSLVNRAPHFVAYEDDGGNTHVIPLVNGQADKAGTITLRNQRIFVKSDDAGVHLVGASAMLTYKGDHFDDSSALTLYRYVNRALEGPITTFPLARLRIDDGMPSHWLQEQTAGGGSKSASYYYDCQNVTVTPDGSVAEFAAATAVYGVVNAESKVCERPPALAPFGRTEYRYYNNRLARHDSLAPGEASPGSGIYYYSYVAGQVFDKTDYDATGAPKQRDMYAYDVRRDREPIDQPGTRVPLFGVYVKPSSTTTTMFESIIEAVDDEAKAQAAALSHGDAPPMALVRAFAARGIDVDVSHARIARYDATHWRLFVDPERPHYLPVTIDANGGLRASVSNIRSVTYEYSRATGLLTADAMDTYNSTGRHETARRQIYYAWQVPEYAVFKERHILTPVAVSIRFSQIDPEPAPGEPTHLAVTTYGQWFTDSDASVTRWAPVSAYTAVTPQAYDPKQPIPIAFNDWSNTAPPYADRWRRMGTVISRLPTGNVIEAVDAAGMSTTSIMDRADGLRVAEFGAASRREVSFTGFESYETGDGWTLNPGGSLEPAIVSGDAHTGTRSLALRPEGPALERSFELDTVADADADADAGTGAGAGGRAYVLSYWVKTPASFAQDGGAAAWTVSVAGSTIDSFAIDSTRGAWVYRHATIRIPATAAAGAGSKATVVISARNQKANASSVLLLDDVMVAPLEGNAGATVYDARTSTPIATLAPNGLTALSLLDSLARPAVGTRGEDHLVHGTSLYLVRQGDDTRPWIFPAADPNAVAEISAQDGGAFANFVQGDAWRNQWIAPDLDGWRVTDGRLLHVRDAADTITFAPSGVGGRALDDYGVRLSVFPKVDAKYQPIVPSHPLELRIGSDLSAKWDPAQPSGWSITIGDKSWSGHRRASGVKPFPTEWMLLAPKDPISGTTSVLLFADGRLVFGQVGTLPIAGAASFTVQDEGVAFASFAMFKAPGVALTYLDGSGKERQKHAFTGTGTRVGQSVYDAIGRAALGVKAFDLAGWPPQYAADAVRTFDPITGVMTGYASDAYPADEGYPYLRTEFFPTAQSLSRKQGMPGKPFAIVQHGELGAEEDDNPHITTFEYGVNVSGEFGDAWPSYEYFVTRTRTPNGDLRLVAKTKTDETVAEKAGPVTAGGTDYRITRYVYDRAGRLVKTLPPAGVEAAQRGDPDADRWATTNTYDFVGLQIEQTTPDAGTRHTVYDAVGRLRFAMDAEGADPAKPLNTIVYTKYDAQGREIEQGTFEAVWDRAFLADKALHDPAYPDAAQPHTWRMRQQWDGDGSDPRLFGRVWKVETSNAPDGVLVSKTFAYDLLGAVTLDTLETSEPDTTPQSVRYVYDAVGRTIRLDYPEGSATPSVTYTFDRVGQVVRIGTPADPSAFAVYRYNALGQVTTTTFGAPSASSASAASSTLTRHTGYNAPGWPSDSRTQLPDGALVFAEHLTYTGGGADAAGYYDGSVASASTAQQDGHYAYHYNYDGVSELRVATNDAAPQDSTGPASYDPNGNILATRKGDAAYQYDYAPYSNRLQRVTRDAASAPAPAPAAAATAAAGAAFTYDRNGSTTSITAPDAGSRALPSLPSLTYDTVTGRTRTITLGAEANDALVAHLLRFSYDGVNGRAIKRVEDASGATLSSTLYVRGTQALPLVELTRTRDARANAGAGAITKRSQFIYGPDGLVGLETGSKRFRVIRDRQGSVRRVVDETGAVAASFDYGPTGGQITGLGGGRSDILFYRYTGQELDEETGLYNYRARLYDPETGRFLSTDPAAQFPSSYIYAGNNPINLVDPDGEEALTAFLIVLIASAVFGAIAGAVTYIVSHQGSFDVGKFLLYAITGAVAGAAGGAGGYGAGLLATAGLATIGVSTSTSIASGVIVGAVTGAADGAISGALSQIGVNLIEGKRGSAIWEGVGQGAWMGAALGGALGAGLGLGTGLMHARTAAGLKKPKVVVGDDPNTPLYAKWRGVKEKRTYSVTRLNEAVNKTGKDDVLSMTGHGSLDDLDIQFNLQVESTLMKLDDIISDMAGFTGKGLDLSAVCYAGSNGIARSMANKFKVPVRAANVSTSVNQAKGVGAYIKWHRTLFQFGTFRTYYPSKLETGWIALFGY